MIDVPVMDMSGKQVGVEKVDPAALGGEVNAQLLKQAVVAYRAAQRQGTVRQKTRAETHGANRKLYRQKGTGRARVGPQRSPTRRGGGRAFPRRPNDFRVRLPRTMRRAARDSAILAKMQAGSTLILDQLKLDEAKTKKMFAVLKALGAAGGCLMAVPAEDAATHRAGRNIPTLLLKAVGDINAHDVLRSRKVVFVREAFRTLMNRPARAAKGQG
ncbi:MAG: 50S ribosomal protein L4 [Phycisphaerae bacterium]